MMLKGPGTRPNLQHRLVCHVKQLGWMRSGCSGLKRACLRLPHCSASPGDDLLAAAREQRGAPTSTRGGVEEGGGGGGAGAGC